MGIFTRASDVISANVNSMLEKAEDPDKLINQLMRELEDTLVDIKASCASAMAQKKRIGREIDRCDDRTAHWNDRAEYAVSRGRDSLAREALLRKKQHNERSESLERELDHCDSIVEQYHADIQVIEEKLNTMREKRRLLVQRHVRAKQHHRAQSTIRRIDTSATLAKIDRIEERIDRMEAEGNLVNYGRVDDSVDGQFAQLERDEEIEQELAALKSKSAAPLKAMSI